MRHMGWLVAIAVAFLALKLGTPTKSAMVPTETMNVMEMQTGARGNLPATLPANPI